MKILPMLSARPIRPKRPSANGTSRSNWLLRR